MSSDPRNRGTSLPPATSERKVRDLDPSVEAELRLQLMQLRDHAIGTTAQVGELRARLREKDAELEKKKKYFAGEDKKAMSDESKVQGELKSLKA